MERPATALLDSPQLQQRQNFTTPFSLVFGMVLTLAVSGYQFGRGNLTVYLLDGLRAVHPELLRNDWFSTQTLQYHAFFSLVTEWLLRLHLLEGGFLVGYLALIVLWHLFWRKLVIEIGGDNRVYLISVFLFYLSAAGISVGVFQFLQDGCFLPSNVASVAMLGGIACWAGGRRVAAGAWLGVAGLFHVNYAVIVIGLWGSLVAWEMLDRQSDDPLRKWVPGVVRGTGPKATWQRTLLASAFALLPSLVNLGLALPDLLRSGGEMPMRDFVAVYVRFRHTHHFDPLHWPAVLWISFLWPIPLAVWAAMRWNSERDSGGAVWNARRETGRVFVLLFSLLVIAFLFAGVWFINEPLVQLCFWRFSIYIKLMSCVGAAFILCDPRLVNRRTLSWIVEVLAGVAVLGYVAFLLTDPADRGAVWNLAAQHRVGIGIVIGLWLVLAIEVSLKRGDLFRRIAMFALPVIALFAWPHFGVGMTPEPDDAQYREVCAWAREPANTPIDAIFLVPPQETDFRLYAERAIVVNFKHVPQLSGEIIAWERRLLDVLGVPDVSGFPHDYTQTMARIGSLYEHRSAGDLYAVAAKYGARYIVVDHSLGAPFDGAIVFHRESNRYIVYDRNAASTQP